jgi:hypothetical protein
MIVVLKRDRISIFLPSLPKPKRSQAESYYGKYIYTSAFALRDFVGVTDIESLGPYVKTQWRDYEDKFLGKKRG